MKKSQEYTVTIRLTSRVGILQQAETEAPPFINSRIINFIGTNTADITIEYTDYVIARGFIEAFDEWIRGCKTTPKFKALQYLSRWSHIIPRLFKIILSIIIIYFSYTVIPNYFSEASTPETWAKFALIYGGSAYILINFISFTGALIEEAIDTFPSLSYLNLNKGDAKLIDAFQKRKSSSMLKLIGGLCLSIVIGIISSKIERLI